jgi:hypothetical protein
LKADQGLAGCWDLTTDEREACHEPCHFGHFVRHRVRYDRRGDGGVRKTPDKSLAMLSQAFFSRFAIGLLACNVALVQLKMQLRHASLGGITPNTRPFVTC